MTLTLMINPQKYIVNCQEYVEPPSYLRSELHEEVTFDFTPIMKNMNQDTTDTIRRYERKNGGGGGGNTQLQGNRTQL